jgi:hypothetical protein
VASAAAVVAGAEAGAAPFDLWRSGRRASIVRTVWHTTDVPTAAEAVAPAGAGPTVLTVHLATAAPSGTARRGTEEASSPIGHRASKAASPPTDRAPAGSAPATMTAECRSASTRDALPR